LKPVLFPKTPGFRLVGLLCMVAMSVILLGCDSQMKAKGTGAAEVQKDPAQVPPLSAVAIREAQRQLAAVGYDPGRIDGVLGKRTRTAIKHFQVDEDVAVTGELTPEVAGLLKRAYSRQRAEQALKNEHARAAGASHKLPDTPSPSYEADDVYVYTDGRVETVLRVGPERTLWETVEGNAYTAYRNFILPPISWKIGATSGENQIKPAAGVKWPLATTENVIFWVGSKAADEAPDAPAVWSGRWRCKAGGAVKVQAVAGWFNAIAIQCNRANPEPGTWKRRTWYFVADVGHYVRRVDVMQGTGRKVTVDLVAVSPGGKGWPPAARGGLDWAIQNALDSGQQESAVEWRSSAVGAMFNIRVKEKIDVSGDVECRRYGIERTGLDQVRLYPAIACRGPGQDRWLTPGLDLDAVSPSSLKLP